MSSEVVHIPRGGDIVRAEDFMPLMTVAQAVSKKEQINAFIAGVMTEGEDYGHMPGENRKEKRKVLLKPGAEKLCSIFGFAPRYEAEQIIEDWTGREHGGEPLFYYRYKCSLYRGDRCMGEAVGSANSWEAKHRYRWVGADQLPSGIDKSKMVSKGSKRVTFEPQFAIKARDTTGRYGKPDSYWDSFEKAIAEGAATQAIKKSQAGKEMSGWEMEIDQTLYRLPNPDSADVVNTCQKMAQKRALVAAVLIVTNCSDAFTQDLEDAVEEPSHQRNTPDQQADLAEKRVAEEKAKTESETPKELKVFFEAIDKDPSRSVEAFEHLRNALGEKGGINGVKAYDALERTFTSKYPRGTADKGVLKGLVRQLWDALQTVMMPEPPKDSFDQHMKQGELIPEAK
jgi:hypothetical protein